MKQLQSSSVQLDAVLATRTEGAPKDSKRTGLDDPLTTSDEPIAAYADDEADEQILKIFGLLHIEAKFAVRIVQTIFTDVRAEADEKSNRLVAYGAKRDLDVIEAMLLKLDEGPGERWSGTFQELPKVTGVVLDYDAKANVASISIGADDGLKADQSFFLVRGQFVLAHATVVKAQPDQSLVKVTRRFVEIRKGDAVSFTATLKVDEHRLPNLNADLDVDPAGSHAPGSPAAVTQPDRRALNDLESRTEKIATEIRATKQSMSKADLERARAQLTREVARAFRLRQQLQSQRISELRERLERMEQQVKRRDGQGAKIIDKRVEDLLK
jgi:hypothetical protein